MAADRQFYNPEGGIALDKDNAVFDVTEWRKAMKRINADHTVFNEMLDQLKINNLYLSHISGENFSHKDIEE